MKEEKEEKALINNVDQVKSFNVKVNKIHPFSMHVKLQPKENRFELGFDSTKSIKKKYKSHGHFDTEKLLGDLQLSKDRTKISRKQVENKNLIKSETEAKYLDSKTSNIIITTGSKNLSLITDLIENEINNNEEEFESESDQLIKEKEKLTEELAKIAELEQIERRKQSHTLNEVEDTLKNDITVSPLLKEINFNDEQPTVVTDKFLNTDASKNKISDESKNNYIENNSQFDLEAKEVPITDISTISPSKSEEYLNDQLSNEKNKNTIQDEIEITDKTGTIVEPKQEILENQEHESETEKDTTELGGDDVKLKGATPVIDNVTEDSHIQTQSDVITTQSKSPPKLIEVTPDKAQSSPNKSKYDIQAVSTSDNENKDSNTLEKSPSRESEATSAKTDSIINVYKLDNINNDVKVESDRNLEPTEQESSVDKSDVLDKNKNNSKDVTLVEPTQVENNQDFIDKSKLDPEKDGVSEISTNESKNNITKSSVPSRKEGSSDAQEKHDAIKHVEPATTSAVSKENTISSTDTNKNIKDEDPGDSVLSEDSLVSSLENRIDHSDSSGSEILTKPSTNGEKEQETQKHKEILHTEKSEKSDKTSKNVSLHSIEESELLSSPAEKNDNQQNVQENIFDLKPILKPEVKSPISQIAIESINNNDPEISLPQNVTLSPKNMILDICENIVNDDEIKSPELNMKDLVTTLNEVENTTKDENLSEILTKSDKNIEIEESLTQGESLKNEELQDTSTTHESIDTTSEDQNKIPAFLSDETNSVDQSLAASGGQDKSGIKELAIQEITDRDIPKISDLKQVKDEQENLSFETTEDESLLSLPHINSKDKLLSPLQTDDISSTDLIPKVSQSLNDTDDVKPELYTDTTNIDNIHESSLEDEISSDSKLVQKEDSDNLDNKYIAPDSILSTDLQVKLEENTGNEEILNYNEISNDKLINITTNEIDIPAIEIEQENLSLNVNIDENITNVENKKVEEESTDSFNTNIEQEDLSTNVDTEESGKELENNKIEDKSLVTDNFNTNEINIKQEDLSTNVDTEENVKELDNNKVEDESLVTDSFDINESNIKQADISVNVDTDEHVQELENNKVKEGSLLISDTTYKSPESDVVSTDIILETDVKEDIDEKWNNVEQSEMDDELSDFDTSKIQTSETEDVKMLVTEQEDIEKVKDLDTCAEKSETSCGVLCTIFKYFLTFCFYGAQVCALIGLVLYYYYRLCVIQHRQIILWSIGMLRVAWELVIERDKKDVNLPKILALLVAWFLIGVYLKILIAMRWYMLSPIYAAINTIF